VTTKLLPPLSSLDPSVVTTLMQSDRLPGLSVDDTNAIKRYYSQPPPSMPIQAVPMPAPTKNSNMNYDVPVGTSSPELMKLFPPGFDFSRLPPDILEQAPKEQSPDFFEQTSKEQSPDLLQQASKEQSPDFSLLPVELLNELHQTYPELRTSTDQVRFFVVIVIL
jgi:hypothetical protein